MTLYNAGSGSSVSGISHSDPQGSATLERAVYGFLSRLEEEETHLSRISGRTDRISITVKLSEKVAEIDLLLNVVAVNGMEGIIFTATPYLTGSTFTGSTGGDIKASNLAQAAMEGVVALKLLEIDPARKLNPDITVITRCTHSLGRSGGSNATFAALLNFPIEMIGLSGGGTLIEGKTFLN